MTKPNPPYEARNKEKCVSTSDVNLHNHLSQKIKEIGNYPSFTRKLRNFILEEPVFNRRISCKIMNGSHCTLSFPTKYIVIFKTMLIEI